MGSDPPDVDVECYEDSGGRLLCVDGEGETVIRVKNPDLLVDVRWWL